MKRVHRMGARLAVGVLILIAAGLLTGFRTDALRANWKYAGASSEGNEDGKTLAFYDAENVEYLADGNVKVWVKSVDASEIEKIVDREKSIVKKAGDKAAQSYYPPYLLSNPDLSTSADAHMEMIVSEEAANQAGMKAMSKGLYEINCRESKILKISTILYKRDGTATYTSDFDRWTPIIPDSGGEALQKILCR